MATVCAYLVIDAARKPWSSATPSGGKPDPLSTSAAPATRNAPTRAPIIHARRIPPPAHAADVGPRGANTTTAPAATATSRQTRTSTSTVGSPVTAGADAATTTAITPIAVPNAIGPQLTGDTPTDSEP